MKLKSKLVALSLVTLLLPWSGWKLLQEMERYLREAQETSLLASARLVAGALPLEFQTRLSFAPDAYVPMRGLRQAPTLDGYDDDWPQAGQGMEFGTEDGNLAVSVLAGRHAERLYLLVAVRRETVSDVSRQPAPGVADRLTLLIRNPRGLLRYDISPGAPGPLQLRSETGEAGQGEGFWLDTPAGFRIELSLPGGGVDSDIAFRVAPASGGQACWNVSGPDQERTLPAQGADRWSAPRLACRTGASAEAASDWQAGGGWVSLMPEWRRLSAWLSGFADASSRVWLVDRDGWVLADSDFARASGGKAPAPQTTWLQRWIYRLVAGSRTDLQDEWPADPMRLTGPAVEAALGGREATSWSQDLDTAVVRNSAGAPVAIDGRVQAAIVVQTSSDGLLLVTNRALGRLLFTTLALAIGLAGALWYFASRLSRRVRRLSGAVSSAMEDRVDPESLPLRSDRDELGELARNNEKLLRAVADYSQYLQTLAGKLSHELQTPLAITRSSLDNLSNQDLDTDSRRFLERAREGVDRQTAIVRAMSEASRLEAAIEAAEWERVDLSGLVSRCVAGYRTLHADRQISLDLSRKEMPMHCAPDLLAQALDKLVENALSLTGPDDEVSVSLRSAAGGYELAVRNEGSRLPDDFQDRLFDSLVSVRSRRGEEPHLGLGLYIVRLVVAAHHGEVSARNLPEEAGVEFLIRLPAEPGQRL
jgi:signal transduction histidine kinase